MLKQLILVGLGGGVGSMLRFLTSVITAKYYSNAFPLATFIVNVVGCLLIGLLIGLFSQNLQSNPHLKLLFITGFCGGYTTFSAFAAENITLIQNNNYLIAILYIGLSMLVGLLAVWAGVQLTKFWS